MNFRSGLIRHLMAMAEVLAVAPPDEYVLKLKDIGCRYIPLPIDRKGTNPLSDLLLLFRLMILIHKERPNVFLGYTAKPNIYGSIAAHSSGVKVINNIAGLGTVFVKENWLNLFLRFLYRIALAESFKVFFQNEEDRQLFIDRGVVSEYITERLPGSGIDLDKFSPSYLSSKNRIRFLVVARMLWEKGVGIFADAAEILKKRGLDAEFCLLGFIDNQDPKSISEQQIKKWCTEGAITYLGTSDDVRKEISKADCIVLPSFYREGTPRCLLEAAAMSKPIITTDSVGCRDVVEDGLNGFLCLRKDPIDLADKMEKVILLSHSERVMGANGTS